MPPARTRFRPGAALDPDGKTRMASQPREWKPLADLLEDEREFIVRLNLPGLERDQVSILMADERTLIVRGHYEPAPGQSVTYHVAERPQVPVERVFHLPRGVLVEDVTASMQLGVLTICLPKRERPANAPRQIVLG